MQPERPLKLVGGYGSPYSRKMRAVLRYRRLPFRWIIRGSSDDRGIPEVSVPLIPVLVFPGRSETEDTVMVDSTPQISRLEDLTPQRSLIPRDPVTGFLDLLIEDFADEWLTKAMYGYRWSYPDDVHKASWVLPLQSDTRLPADEARRRAEEFGQRQVERLGLVGCNEVTRPVIENSYRRTLEILDDTLEQQAFLAGARPGRGDFGVFGQLSQLVLFDPTPAGIAARVAPRVVAWVNHVEDLHWLEVSESGWLDREQAGARLGPLLGEIGRVYAPFLLANARALEHGADRVECEIDGAPWEQPPFRYQGKCLRWLREAHAALEPRDRRAVDELLDGTGCEALFA
ncbi:MAG TPA: glutathione S-transferase family protein [Gammaproteobacteria bacterium]|nr:glutathione S-transferase family protein [Gammaproteobacteria bacterium]